MKKIFIMLLISLFILAGCSSKEKVNVVQDSNITINPCSSVSLKAEVVNVNQEKKWVSVKLSNDGNRNIDETIIRILSGKRLTAKVKKSLFAGETRVETTNYGNLEGDSIGLEVMPLIKIGSIEIACSTKGLILYKIVANQ